MRPMSDADVERNLGGLTLQGIDDNAVGVGVLLELAERLKNVSTHYGIRFIASSGEEEGNLGAQNILKRMSDAEKKNTLLVINLDNLVVGDKLYFNSGRSTPASIRKLTRDRALAIARSKGIAAYTNPGLNHDYPQGTGCCNDASIFDSAGSRSCPWRPRTGRWVRKMAISSATNPPPSREEPAGMTYSWITSSILIKLCRGVSNAAAAMSSR
jgi:alkaline phosphatase isozyme conversion protein